MVRMDIQDFLQAMGENISKDGVIEQDITEELYNIQKTIEEVQYGDEDYETYETYTVWGNDVLDALDNTDYFKDVTDLMNQRFPLQVLIDDDGKVKLGIDVRDTEEDTIYPFDGDHVKKAISEILPREVEVIGYGREQQSNDYYSPPYQEEREFLISVEPNIERYLDEVYDYVYQYVAEIANENSREEILERTKAYIARQENMEKSDKAKSGKVEITL